MEDVVVSIPGIQITDSEPLVGYFAGAASLPMYDDEVIRWYSDDKDTRKACRHIEEVTGINFKRTRDIDKAEIISERGNPGNRLWTGVAKWSSDDPVWRITVRKNKKYQSTVLHELAHALGMDHPENHWKDRDTIMSYKRDKTITKLFPKDIDILTGLYF